MTHQTEKDYWEKLYALLSKDMIKIQEDLQEIKIALHQQKVSQAVLTFKKQKPLKIPLKKKCPSCLKIFEARVNQQCCSRGCGRKHFYATHEIKFVSNKKNINGQYELPLEENLEETPEVILKPYDSH